MEREQIFARKLEALRKLAVQQGNCVTDGQVRDTFSELELNEEQYKLVFDYLVQNRIGIGSPADPDDYLTERELGYLENYLEDISMLKVYSGGELEALTLSAMAGDIPAKRSLTEAYLKDVADVARLYAGQGVPVEDLVGEGNVALSFGVEMLGSLEKPDQAPGMLMKMVMDAMEDYIRKNEDNEKTDRKAAGHVNRVADRAGELAEALHRKVTPDELAAETGLSLKSIREAMRISGYQIEDIEYAEDGI